jgi:hypothetical protein
MSVVATTVLADPPGPFRQHLSLMHGWVPLTAQIMTAAVLVFAVGWRSRRWRLVWLPVAALAGVTLAWLTNRNIAANGLAGDAAPRRYGCGSA